MPNNHPNALPIGTQIQEYRIERVLGVGGFGITYLVMDINLDRQFVIKEFFPAAIAVRHRTIVNPQTNLHKKAFQLYVDHFLLEAQNLAKFDHPNIVKVSRFFSANNTAYFVMEYAEGESLQDYLDSIRDPLDEDAVLKIFHPILDALKVVHAQKLLHRDIKPGNILLVRGGEPLLIDFGAAREAIGLDSHSIDAVLTPGFAPAEQYETRSTRQGPWTDLYSVAATMYYCITGRVPVPASDRTSASIYKEPDPLIPIRKFTRDRFCEGSLSVIEQSLKVKYTDRPQTVDEFLRILGGPEQKTIPPTGPSTGPPSGPSDTTEEDARKLLVSSKIKGGDKHFKAGKYALAKKEYQLALGKAKGAEQGKIKKKIAECDRLSDAERSRKFSDAEGARMLFVLSKMKKGDTHFKVGNYALAKKEYQLALDKAKEAERGVIAKKISECDRLSDNQGDQRRLVISRMKDGDRYLSAGKYALAKKQYELAYRIAKNVERGVIRQKIAECVRLSDAEAHRKLFVRSRIIDGDQLLSAGKFALARKQYQLALAEANDAERGALNQSILKTNKHPISVLWLWMCITIVGMALLLWFDRDRSITWLWWVIGIWQFILLANWEIARDRRAGILGIVISVVAISVFWWLATSDLSTDFRLIIVSVTPAAMLWIITSKTPTAGLWCRMLITVAGMALLLWLDSDRSMTWLWWVIGVWQFVLLMSWAAKVESKKKISARLWGIILFAIAVSVFWW
ncbi:MAG: serine/threonine-protein kinase, partial [Candidatus Electryoneaceae bacterium]|nr:serine/threonine-protein kinase [Candidatus Electryoneaceae bacterium]